MTPQNALVKTTPQSLQKIGNALAITDKLLQDDNPLGLPDLIPYRKGDKWDFCNRKKEIVIECVYDGVKPFYGNLAIVSIKGTCYGEAMTYQGVIDLKGNKVLHTKFSAIETYIDGVIKVTSNEGEYYECRFIDQKGKLIQTEYVLDNSSEYLSNGLIRATRHDFIYRNFDDDANKYGLINMAGKEILPFKYWSFSEIGDNLLLVESNPSNMWKYQLGVSNKKGNWIIPLSYDELDVVFKKLTHFEGFNKEKFQELLSIGIGNTEESLKKAIPHKSLYLVWRNEKQFYIDKNGTEYYEE